MGAIAHECDHCFLQIINCTPGEPEFCTYCGHRLHHDTDGEQNHAYDYLDEQSDDEKGD